MIWDLIVSFLRIGLLSIGGGYAALPLIRNEVIDVHAWMTMSEFNDLLVLAESTPGPIAINASTFIGCRISGVIGGVIATLACILPAFCITVILAIVYKKYHQIDWMRNILTTIKPAVVGLIGAAGLSVFCSVMWGGDLFSFSFAQLQPLFIVIFLIALFLIRKWKPNVLLIIIGTGLVNLLYHFVMG